MVRRCTQVMLTWIALLILCCLHVSAAPVPLQPPMIDYLTKFGYLPESTNETGVGNLRTDETLRYALADLQEFAGLRRTGVLDKATQELVNRPRCGLPDRVEGSRKKRYAVLQYVWRHTNLTWSLRTWFTHGLDYHSTRHDLAKALSVWSRYSKLTFTELNSDNADILVYFEKGQHGDSYPFDGKGHILAHAFFPGSGRGGDVHFDIEEPWHLTGDRETNRDKTSLLSVAAHEFGHSLGLAHSSVVGALMYPWYQGFSNVDLHEDDMFAIQQLYGAREKQWAKNTGQRTRVFRPSPTTTTTTTTTTTSTTTQRPHMRPVYPPPTSAPEVPDTCNTSYDAIAVIRGEVFIFKGKYLWRVGDKGVQRGYPALVERFWPDLPKDFTMIDAAYERLTDKKIVFFIGRYYYVFQGHKLEPGYPRPLTDLGLPHYLHKIDASLIWSYNSKTYLFSGTEYWKLDEDAGKVELDYPRYIGIVWKGVDYGIDTAFQWKDGVTYFFKGTKFWKFKDSSMRLIDEAHDSAEFWMHCSSKPGNHPRTNDIPTDRPKIKQGHNSDPSGTDSVASLSFTIILAIIICGRLVNNL